MSPLKKDLVQILDEHRVIDDRDALFEFGRDRTRIHTPNPSFVVFPRSTEEVRRLVAYCSEHSIAFVPSGGRTGYAAAAVASNGEVVISMNKMNRIVKIDLESGSVELEAGAILENVQNAVAGHGMYFPLDFASRGSCQIGGCISTNAGGLKVIKYGMTRELVLGLEVVTPDGEILDLNANLHKDNSGYDLKQLFIGAEGTLGVITKATMKIVSPPKDLRLALLAVQSFHDILQILRSAKLSMLDLTAFEFFTEACLGAVLSHMPHARRPFASPAPFYVLLEIDDRAGQLQGFIEQILNEKLIENAVPASTAKEFRELWSLRENISESISLLGQVHKNDVAVPVASMPQFIAELERMIREKYDRFEILLFGHIGDGNIHINLIDKRGLPSEEFQKVTEILDEDMSRLIRVHRGSISAEHGIGLLKKRLLLLSRQPQEIEWMKRIKTLMDPKNICNPGKILET